MSELHDDGQALKQLYETMDFLYREMRGRNRSYRNDDEVVSEIEEMIDETQKRINQYFSNTCDNPMLYMEGE